MLARRITYTLTVWICSAVLATAQQPPASSAPTGATQDQALPALDVRGTFDLGFRWTDTDGARRKYREDVNLRTGARLFNLDLQIRPSGGQFFDVVSLTGDHLGGDPFETFAVRAQRFGRFTFEYRRHRSEYFYQDLLLPHDQADVRLSSGGDFHTFDFERTNDRFRFDVQATDRVRAFVDFNHQSRVGESATTLDISRDEFELDQPMEQRKNDATVGVQLTFDRVSVYADQTVRDYESDGHLFLPGASAGENPTNATELFFFDQRLPFDFTMPQSTVKVNARPSDRLSISVGFVRADLDADFQLSEVVRGVAFSGAPLNTSSTGSGSLDRTTTAGQFDVEYAVNERVALIGGGWFGRFDQEATAIENGQLVSTGLEISTNQVEIGAQVTPRNRVTLTGGLRFERRDPTLIHEDGPDPHPETDRTTVFVNASVAPKRTVSLSAEYERGDYDNPFTSISPTSVDRLKARIRYRPLNGLAVVGSLLVQRLDNSVSDASLNATAFTGALSYEAGDASLSASYSRHSRSHDVPSLVNFVGSTERLIPILYDADVDMANGGLRYQVLPRLAPGVDFTVYRNRGTLGLDWRRIRVFADVMARTGYFVRLAYLRHSLDEVDFDFDDYDANIFELSIGYRF